MMYLFLIGRVYPAICVAALIALFEIAKNLRRRKNALFYPVAVLGVTVFVSAVLWIVFRGDLHSNMWIKSWMGAWQGPEI